MSLTIGSYDIAPQLWMVVSADFARALACPLGRHLSERVSREARSFAPKMKILRESCPLSSGRELVSSEIVSVDAQSYSQRRTQFAKLFRREHSDVVGQHTLFKAS
jgi:hypothetical protein